MPRQNRRRDDAAGSAHRPPVSSAERHDAWRGEQYVVRTVAGAGATKAYRCPGCDQEIRPGLAHLVAWASHDTDAGDRRHWHTSCWAASERRAPGVQRGRSAPRY